MILEFLQQALLIVALLTVIPLGVCVGVGLGVSVLQTVFQIQEQSIAFFLKSLAVFSFLFLVPQVAFELVSNLFTQALHLSVEIGR